MITDNHLSNFWKKATIMIVILVLILGAGLAIFTDGRLTGTTSPVAHASSNQEISVFLPLVFDNSVSTSPNSFGADTGPIRPSRGLDVMKDAGSYWLRRVSLDWSAVEPNPGDRNWAALAGLETELKNASDRGMQVILAVRTAPAWARSDLTFTCSSVKPEYLDDLNNFVYEAVLRYSQEPYNVKYWELWNEPDVAPDPDVLDYTDAEFGCWGDPEDEYYGGGYYADMLQIVYPSIKAADPDATVLVGGLLLNCDPRTTEGCINEGFRRPALYLEGILRHNGANDGGNYFDGVSFHAYDYYFGELGKYGNPNFNTSWDNGGPVSWAKADYIMGLLADPVFGAPGKILMNTEAALVCSEQDPCDTSPTSEYEYTKAYYLTETFAYGKIKGLDATIWFTVLGWRDSGLLYDDLSPRLAYHSFKVAKRALENASYNQTLNLDRVYGYEFYRDGFKVWLLWSRDGENHTVQFEQTPDRIYNVFGEDITLANEISVDLEPVWVEWYP